MKCMTQLPAKLDTIIIVKQITGVGALESRGVSVYIYIRD